MGNIHIPGFKGGLDTTRLPETTTVDSLIFAVDGHINRGGELEQRAAFIKFADLPSGKTKSVSASQFGLVVFGSGAAPVPMPVGTTYQQLAHPDGVTALARVTSSVLFSGSIFALAQYEDGSLYAFYNGVILTDISELRARTKFQIVGGAADGVVSSITVGGVEILGAPIAWTGDNTSMAAAIANQILEFGNGQLFTAVSTGNLIGILAAVEGATPNGQAVVVTASDVSFTAAAPLAGGITAVSAAASTTLVIAATQSIAGTAQSLTINGQEILGATVAWTGNSTTMAAAIASQINLFNGGVSYIAQAVGTNINIAAVAAGVASNGFVVVFTSNLAFTAPPPLAGGANGIEQTGSFAASGNQKLFMLTAAAANFSGLGAPTAWFAPEAAGAGFIDMSDEASNAETLTSVRKYQGFYAFFSERTTQIWYIDPDPSLNKQQQVLDNTGTFSGRSTAQVGDQDVFYLDESGVRSLRARYATTAAATSDIGVPVDALIQAELAQLTNQQRSEIICVIEPRDGRYWLAIQDTIYVFSQFPQKTIAAWTTYKPGFVIDDMVVFNRRVYVRSGDALYSYGGTGPTLQYDDTVVEGWLPYCDAGNPSLRKTFTGFDCACRGTWAVRVAFDPQNQDASDKLAIVKGTTYDGGDTGGCGEGTHISLRFRGSRVSATAPAVLSEIMIHYDADEVADDEN